MALGSADSLKIGVKTASQCISGVEENPTERLIERLDKLCEEFPDSLPFNVAGTKVLRVAAHDVRLWIQEDLFRQNIGKSDEDFVVVHMGVDERYDKIKLEKCAYNEASFRVPDLVGWQPNQAPVDDADDFGLRLDTQIDVDRLADTLTGRYPLETSENAGRTSSSLPLGAPQQSLVLETKQEPEKPRLNQLDPEDSIGHILKTCV